MLASPQPGHGAQGFALGPSFARTPRKFLSIILRSSSANFSKVSKKLWCVTAFKHKSRYFPRPDGLEPLLPIGADTLHDTPRALAPASTRSSAACDRACSRRRRAGARESSRQQSCSLSSALADLAVASGAALKVCALREPGSPMHGGGALRAVIVARLHSSILKFFSVAAELQLIVRGRMPGSARKLLM